MKKVIVIIGPTAVGKTKIAIEIAKKYNLDIISGDSVAVYKRLNIGSAKPTTLEMEGVKHHLIDILDLDDKYSVFDFQKKAREIIEENDISLICGGTGLYIQSAIFNYEFESSSHNEEFELEYSNYTNEELYNKLIELDPLINKDKLHVNNRRRILRALEVAIEKGSFSKFNKAKEPIYDYFVVYLNKSNRNILYERINKRVDIMIKNGLIEEAKELYLENKIPNAIGYTEFIDFFKGEKSLELVIEDIKKNTRHLAKRQITWFKNQMETKFYEVNFDDLNETINQISCDIDKFIKKEINMKKVLIINGPNLNMLGLRPKDFYGTKTLKEIEEMIKEENASEMELVFFQSNYEGAIIEFIQKNLSADGIIINPAAYTHTSVAIHDTLEMFNGIIIEVHLSEVDNREDYRKINYIRPLVNAVFAGKKEFSYIEAIKYLKNYFYVV